MTTFTTKEKLRNASWSTAFWLMLVYFAALINWPLAGIAVVSYALVYRRELRRESVGLLILLAIATTVGWFAGFLVLFLPLLGALGLALSDKMLDDAFAKYKAKDTTEAHEDFIEIPLKHKVNTEESQTPKS